MRMNWKKFNFRDIFTIGAQLATIISMILTWIMYTNIKNPPPDTSSGSIISYPLLVGIIIVNSMLLIFFSASSVRSTLIRLNGKKYQLEKKFEIFNSSNSPYLFNLRTNNPETETSLIERTRKAIKTIDESKAFDQDIYYMLLFTLFHTAEGNINVVSILDDNEWIDTLEENEFLRINLGAAERRLHLNRIFVVKESEVNEKLNNRSIQSFIGADHTYIHLFVIFQEQLPSNIINDIGSGFIDFYGYAVACDIFSDNEIRGYLKFEPAEIERFNRIYMRLNQFYRPLNQDFSRQYLVNNQNNYEPN